MRNQVKTIDIQAKEWFHKSAGNSYFAGIITVNYGMSDQPIYEMPFQYGYEEQYICEALSILKANNVIDTISKMELRKQNIIINASIQTGCKKSELKNI